MSKSHQDLQKEFEETQKEYDQSLKKNHEKLKEVKQCFDKYYWRRHSKCFKSGIVDALEKANVETAVLEQERDQLASRLHEPMDFQSMYSSCMQKASYLNDRNDLLERHGNISYFFSGRRPERFNEHSQQLMRCAILKREHEKLKK